MAERFNVQFWSMGMDNFAKFFAELNKRKTKSLSLTKQVLDERKRLEATVEGLQPLIQRGLVKMEEVRKTKLAISNNQAQINANVNVDIEVEVTEAQKVDISDTGHFLTNCSKCHVTCHYPCAYDRDADKQRCWAMDPTTGTCRICPQNCVWNIHFNQSYRWEYVRVKRKQTSNQLKDNYEKMMKKKLSAEDLVQVLEQELKEIEAKVLESVTTVAQSIQRLEEIALRPNPFSTPQYIDLMIASEQQEKKPGFNERIDSLRKLRQQADITHKIRSGQTIFAGVPAVQTIPVAANPPAARSRNLRPPRRTSNGKRASGGASKNLSVEEERFKNLF